MESRFVDDYGGLARLMKFTAVSALLASYSLMGLLLFVSFWASKQFYAYH